MTVMSWNITGRCFLFSKWQLSDLRCFMYLFNVYSFFFIGWHVVASAVYAVAIFCICMFGPIKLNKSLVISYLAARYPASVSHNISILNEAVPFTDISSVVESCCDTTV